MRISRKRRPEKPLIPRYNKNEWIKASTVRLLGSEGENLGVFSISEALSMAREQEVDLVEINPKTDPPVAKLVDFGSFKYQKEKEAKKQKIKSHVSDIKGIRLSIRISAHDMDVRRKQAEKFLERGDKVKTEIILRGREKARSDLADQIINRFVRLLEETMPLRFEQEPKRQGGKVTAIVAKK